MTAPNDTRPPQGEGREEGVGRETELQPDGSTFLPQIHDAVTVLEGVLRDASAVEWLAVNAAQAFGALDPTERVALGQKHPDLAYALLAVEDWVSRHRPDGVAE